MDFRAGSRRLGKSDPEFVDLKRKKEYLGQIGCRLAEARWPHCVPRSQWRSPIVVTVNNEKVGYADFRIGM
jgi:hypothetical protein